MDDINPDTKLSDAVFNIIDAKGQVVRTNLTTDKDGKVSASNLRPEIINSWKRKLRKIMI